MAGRTYEEPGAPASEAEPELVRKRLALIEDRRARRRRGKDSEYVAYPPPTPVEMVDAATRYIRRRVPDADLIIEMLGLDLP